MLDIITFFTGFFLLSLRTIGIFICVVIFIGGLIKFIRNRQNEEKQKAGKKIMIISLVVFLFIIVSNAAIYVYRDIKIKQLNWPEYYKNIARKCNLRWHYKDCINSAYDLYEKGLMTTPEDGCPEPMISVTCLGCVSNCIAINHYAIPDSRKIKNIDECYNIGPFNWLIDPEYEASLSSDKKRQVVEAQKQLALDMHDSCIMRYIEQNREYINMELCEKMYAEKDKNECKEIMEIRNIVKLKDSSLCRDDRCRKKLALELKNLEEYCRLSNFYSIAACKGHFAVYHNDVELCEEASDREWCLHMIVEKTLDPTICPKINLDFRREDCYKLIKESNKN